MEDIAHQLNNFLSSSSPQSLNMDSPTPFDDAPSTVKLEDIQHPHPSAVPETPSSCTNSEQKPAKKRKSWGQVLPEPKTNLPPRKRAKTADEKEQRRIERVKRNRLAAHNSRERKRQEVELLQSAKDALEQQLKDAQAKIQTMAAELNTYKALSGEAPVDVKQYQFDVNRLSPPMSDADSHTTRNTIDPSQTFPSPNMSITDTMDSPMDTDSQPTTPRMTPVNFAETDLTHHSAAMMCDLQCQSESQRSSLASSLSPKSRALAIYILFSQQTLLWTSLLSSISRLSATSPSTNRKSLTSRLSSLLPTTTPSARLALLMTWIQASSSLFLPTQALPSHATGLATKAGKLSGSTLNSKQSAMDRQWAERDAAALLRLSQSTGRGSSISEEIRHSIRELDSFLGISRLPEIREKQIMDRRRC